MRNMNLLIELPRSSNSDDFCVMPPTSESVIGKLIEDCATPGNARAVEVNLIKLLEKHGKRDEYPYYPIIKTALQEAAEKAAAERNNIVVIGLFNVLFRDYNYWAGLNRFEQFLILCDLNLFNFARVVFTDKFNGGNIDIPDVFAEFIANMPVAEYSPEKDFYVDLVSKLNEFDSMLDGKLGEIYSVFKIFNLLKEGAVCPRLETVSKDTEVVVLKNTDNSTKLTANDFILAMTVNKEELLKTHPSLKDVDHVFHLVSAMAAGKYVFVPEHSMIKLVFDKLTK